MSRVQAELEESERSLADFTEHLKKLEDEAADIMKACQEAEVSAPGVRNIPQVPVLVCL